MTPDVLSLAVILIVPITGLALVGFAAWPPRRRPPYERPTVRRISTTEAERLLR